MRSAKNPSQLASNQPPNARFLHAASSNSVSTVMRMTSEGEDGSDPVSVHLCDVMVTFHDPSPTKLHWISSLDFASTL